MANHPDRQSFSLAVGFPLALEITMFPFGYVPFPYRSVWVRPFVFGPDSDNGMKRGLQPIGLGLTASFDFFMPPPDGFEPGLQAIDGPYTTLMDSQGYVPPPMPGYQRTQIEIEAGVSPNNDYWSIQYSALDVKIPTEARS